MTFRLFVPASLLALAAACGGTDTSAVAVRPLEVQRAWARPADSGVVSAVYLVIVNGDTSPATFIGAASALAESVSLHETMQMGDMVHMMPLDSAQVIAANDSLVLTEGAKHLMVTGLRRKLAAGDSLPLTLSFAGNKTIAVNAAVRAP
ncbi:MAG: copper chaperone PCu(A)C [Gemmatimonadaceae bacterium]|nr:copper chaperone PCu(A)C [Gemmatimonadaceae bacterium]